jgi:hypothetical protein
MRLLWPLAVRRLHDALIEDSLDRAAADVGGRPWQPRRLGGRVRAARYVASAMGGRSGRNGHSSNA